MDPPRVATPPASTIGRGPPPTEYLDADWIEGESRTVGLGRPDVLFASATVSLRAIRTRPLARSMSDHRRATARLGGPR